MIDCDHPKRALAQLCNRCARTRDSHMYRAGRCPDCGVRCRAGSYCRKHASQRRAARQRALNAVRDRNIARAWQSGATVKLLAEYYGLTRTRIYQIIERELGQRPRDWKSANAP